MSSAMLFCGDPLDPRRVDDHFAAEAAAARDAGAAVALLDHDALIAGDADAAVRRVPRDQGPVWYRGWMIPGDRYRLLADALTARGGQLRVGPAAYREAHELPGWYPAFAELTPHSVWMRAQPGDIPSREELAALVTPLRAGPAVVKDYVKSRKHEWQDACYVPDVTDTARLHSVVSRFVERQAEFLAGGVVVRTFEEFTSGGEARVWWLDTEPVLVGPHPDTPDRVHHPDLDIARDAVRALRNRFVTTDLALRSDGAWRVIEVGDGQVSDLPRTVDPALIGTALLGSGCRDI